MTLDTAGAAEPRLLRDAIIVATGEEILKRAQIISHDIEGKVAQLVGAYPPIRISGSTAADTASPEQEPPPSTAA